MTLGTQALFLGLIFSAFQVVFVRQAEAPPRVTLLHLAPSIPAREESLVPTYPHAPQPSPRRPLSPSLHRQISSLPVTTVPPLLLPAATEEAWDDVRETGREEADIDPEAYRRLIQDRIDQARFYPAEAARRRWQGMTHVAFVLNRDGSAFGIDIVRSSGHRVLDQAARDAVLHAQPFPVIPEGLPESLDVTVPIQFLLDEPGTRRIAAQ